MWFVDGSRGMLVHCCLCGDAILAGELRFTWSPACGQLEPRRGYFHTACAVRAGTHGPHLPVRRPYVNEASDLPRKLRAELYELLAAFGVSFDDRIVDLTLDGDTGDEDRHLDRGSESPLEHRVERMPKRPAASKVARLPNEILIKRPAAYAVASASTDKSRSVAKPRATSRCVVQKEHQHRISLARPDGTTEHKRSHVHQEKTYDPKRGLTGKKVERRDKHVVKLKSGKTQVTETVTIRRVSWR